MTCLILVWEKLGKKPQTTVKLLPLGPIKDVFHQPSHHKMLIWWYPSLTPKISRLMPDKRPDIYQSTISVLSCFSSPHSLSTRPLTIHHRLWSPLSKCQREPRTSFSQKDVATFVCAWRVNWETAHGRKWAGPPSNSWVCVGAAAPRTRHGINSIHYLAGSSIDGAFSSSWWTSHSDKVYHSGLSDGISKHQGNWRGGVFFPAREVKQEKIHLVRKVRWSTSCSKHLGIFFSLKNNQ